MSGLTTSILTEINLLLLNSHHDTVRPNQAYTNDPFKAIVKEGKLYGFSNDAGGCLVSLFTFVHFMFQKTVL
jgi:acetylornithine deacetylase